jgi:hypothetical protein
VAYFESVQFCSDSSVQKLPNALGRLLKAGLRRNLCPRKLRNTTRRQQNTPHMLLDTTQKLANTTTPGTTRRPPTMRTPRTGTPPTLDITPKRQLGRIPRSTARSNAAAARPPQLAASLILERRRDLVVGEQPQHPCGAWLVRRLKPCDEATSTSLLQSQGVVSQFGLSGRTDQRASRQLSGAQRTSDSSVRCAA